MEDVWFSQPLTVFISFIYHDILWGGPSMKNFPKLKANKPTISFSLLLLQVFSELKHFPSLTQPSSFPPFLLSSFSPSSLLPPFLPPSSLPPSLLSSALPSSLLFLPSSLPLRYILKYICLGQLSWIMPPLYVIKRSSLDVLDIDISLAEAKINPIYFRTLN